MDWYGKGRPPATQLIESEGFPIDKYGRKPVRRVVEAWVNERGWRERADVLDAQADTQINDELVALKVAMLRKQAAQAAAVRQKAFDHLINNEFDSSASAVAAFLKSSELERLAVGLSKQIERLAEMRDDEVLQMVKELAERAGTTIVDASEVPVESSAEGDAEPLD